MQNFTIPLFAKYLFGDVLETERRKLLDCVNQLSIEELDAAHFEQKVASLSENFRFAPLNLNEEQIVLDEPKEVEAEFRSDLGRIIRRKEWLLRCVVPYSGDSNLFHCNVNLPINVPRGVIDASCLVFIYQVPSHEIETVRRQFND
jgi:hypothetical protein